MKIMINESIFTFLFEKVDLEQYVNIKAAEEVRQRQGDPQTVEDWIADFFTHNGKITPNSFYRNLDKNYTIERLNFINSNGTPIDELAMTLTNSSNLEISNEDIVEFIKDYKSPSNYWDLIKQKTKHELMGYYMQEPINEIVTTINNKNI
jgi:hypothetical protein